MPSDIGDYIQTFMGLKQMQNQTEQVALQAREQAVQGVNIFMQLARQTANPGELAMLSDRFAELGVASREQLMGLLPNVTPTQEALQSYMTQRGIGSLDEGQQTELARDTASSTLTGQGRGQRAVQARQEAALNATPMDTPFGEFLSQAFASQALAGMTPGQATIDAVMLGLPTAELQQGARIKLGTGLSAEDDAQVQAQKANLGFNYNQLAAQSAYQMAGLELDRQKIGMMLKKGTEAGFDPGDITAAINAKTAILKQMTEAKNKNPSDPEMAGYIGGLNAINQRLKQMGLPYEPPITSVDALRSNFDKMIQSWFRSHTRQ